MRLFFVLFLATVYCAQAQTRQVPHKMQFAGMTLTIRDDARREIQKDVNALTQSPRHHNIKVERAKTYFPIIEKVFQEERVPDDFKYLVLQESALIADAVSVSNAVGFWQFKDFTAVEMGLRVDKEIDERLNIVSSSRAAARYIKKNNFYFNNWIFALQAYQMGAGGAMRSLPKDMSGARHMTQAAMSPGFWPALALFTVTGCLMAVNGIAANTMLQLEAPDHLRGRVMGFYSFTVLGMAPFGSLQAGWVSEHFGVRTSLALGGVVCLLVASAIGYSSAALAAPPDGT